MKLFSKNLKIIFLICIFHLSGLSFFQSKILYSTPMHHLRQNKSLKKEAKDKNVEITKNYNELDKLLAKMNKINFNNKEELLKLKEIKQTISIIISILGIIIGFIISGIVLIISLLYNK